MSPAINLGPAKRIADILRPPDHKKEEKKRDPKPPKEEKPTRGDPPPDPAPTPDPVVGAVRVTAQSPFRELGNTSRDAFRAALSRSIGITPAPPAAEADTIYHNLEPYGLTRLAAAMAWIERHNETYPPDEAYYPRGYHNLWAVKKNGGWARYPSYTDAAKDWASIVLGRTYSDLTTIAQFINRYAPDFENDTNGYIQLVVEEANALPLADGVTPAPEPEPKPLDLFAAVFGGKSYTIITQHNEGTSLPYYAYYAGHGGDRWHHPGYDLGAPLGTTLYAPFRGTVTCVGTDQGQGSWQQSCGAFAFVSNFSGAPPSGVGRVELLHEDGKRSLIYGHCWQCLVKLGQTVQPGTPVARLGGMNSAHVHLEARRWLGSDYTIVDPKVLFGDAEGGVAYVERLPISQPSEFDVSWTVKVESKTAPVLQTAFPNSPKVAADLTKGEAFEAAYLMIAPDGTPYWISKASGRVPMAKDAAERFKELLLA